ncbi:Flagellar hook protein FlgE [Sulfidibacter corallicola]|uniref:Flagellar hook protein FlgE n=1 Tax=Sulfidibacter corallicola TaxID=2818388 RepID=A0A8A4TNU1_SULCO|nr:flagellar hook protein FlgE [Sulfidibacter corallicola]QTD51097.1 flagellar hook protein FlgE [Sulfidibacter corallicola]
MLPTFYSALTGLRSHATAINVVGNNLANINTTGYKRSDINFAQIMAGEIQGFFGAANPVQFGLGARTTRIGPTHLQGAVRANGINSNLALQGEGFFQVSDGTRTAYTRAGNFSFDLNGNLVAPNGWNVQGFTEVDADGNVVRTGTPANLQIDFEQPSPPSATSLVRYITNLSAQAGAGETFNTTIDIWDSAGQSHRLDLEFVKSETENQWTYQFSLDEGDVIEGATGTVTFDAQGRLSTINGLSVDDPAAANPIIRLGNLPANADGLVPEDQQITWDLIEFGGADDGTNDSHLTNFSSTSANGTFFQDGFGSGDLNRIEFTRDGTMLGFFTNGETHPLGAVAVVNFNNLAGLKQIDANFFQETGASGEPLLLEGNGGTVVFGGALESSNVDIADEFTNLIIHQRGYQSNSKSVTTADQVLQEIINLKR